ncbi:hypothetical protein [Treponema sp.]|uniref:hypothetical protein n=1 Tax=Treponema sp. TaxID=166 RepID=UPI003EFFB07D
MRRILLALFFAPLVMLVSCMNTGGSGGSDGAVRIAVPGSGARGTYTLSKDNAGSYRVFLISGGDVLDTKTAVPGGADIVFEEVAPGEYTVKVEAWDTKGALLARKSASVKVKSGETAECSIALILLANTAMESKYYLLWNLTNNEYALKAIEDLNDYDEFTNAVSSVTCPLVAQAEDLDGNYYYMSSEFAVYHTSSNISNDRLVEPFSGDESYQFKDPLYYDASTNTLWTFFKQQSEELSYGKVSEPQSEPVQTDQGLNVLDFAGKRGLAFAVQGNVLYLAYEDSGGCYLQRAIINDTDTESATVTLAGSAKSVEQLGFYGEITDIAILYDGTVYVLISNVGGGESENITNGSIYYYIEENDTYYSRGALLKIESTSSGFEVVDSLGWTENSRTISPVGNAVFTTNGETYTLKSKTAYIPQYTESGSKFYGPRRFVAIKPKEIAIADCGFNIVMPDADKSLNGKLFNHNRVLTVNLRDFAISSSKEYGTDLKFAEVNFSDTTGVNSGVIIRIDGANEGVTEK